MQVSTSPPGPLAVDVADFVALVKERVGCVPLALLRKKQRLKVVFATKGDRDLFLSLSSFMYANQRLFTLPWTSKTPQCVILVGNLYTPLSRLSSALNQLTGGGLLHLERESIGGVLTERVVATFKRERPSTARFACDGKHYSIIPLDKPAAPSQPPASAASLTAAPAPPAASSGEPDSYVFLVQARRPESLADENAEEAADALSRAYRWFVHDLGYPPRTVFVFATEGLERRFPEAQRAGTFLLADPLTFLGMHSHHIIFSRLFALISIATLQRPSIGAFRGARRTCSCFWWATGRPTSRARRTMACRCSRSAACGAPCALTSVRPPGCFP